MSLRIRRSHVSVDDLGKVHLEMNLSDYIHQSIEVILVFEGIDHLIEKVARGKGRFQVMDLINLSKKVDADGILRVDISLPELAGDELDVIMICQLLHLAKSQKTTEELGYPSDFFNKTAGCLANDPIEI